MAYFPAYPLVLWALHAVTGVSVKLLGTLVTLACGAGAVVLFRRWCGDRADRTPAMAAVVTLLLYPYCFYLMGSLYADALFLVADPGRLRPARAGPPGAGRARRRGRHRAPGRWASRSWSAWWRSRCGATGTIARSDGGSASTAARLRPADAGVLLSLGGLVGWMTYLGVRFGHPLAFEEVQQAPGWDQGEGPRTWFKVMWFQQL